MDTTANGAPSRQPQKEHGQESLSPPAPYLDRTGLEQGPAIGTWRPGHTSIAAGELRHCDVEGGCRQCCGQEGQSAPWTSVLGKDRRKQKAGASSLKSLPEVWGSPHT